MACKSALHIFASECRHAAPWPKRTVLGSTLTWSGGDFLGDLLTSARLGGDCLVDEVQRLMAGNETLVCEKQYRENNFTGSCRTAWITELRPGGKPLSYLARYDGRFVVAMSVTEPPNVNCTCSACAEQSTKTASLHLADLWFSKQRNNIAGVMQVVQGTVQMETSLFEANTAASFGGVFFTSPNTVITARLKVVPGARAAR